MKRETKMLLQKTSSQKNLPLKRKSSVKDFLSIYQSNISNIIIQSPFFYLLQKIEMLIIAIISNLAFFASKEKSDSISDVLKYSLLVCYISPSLFENPFMSSYLVVGIILFFIFLMIAFTLYIGLKIENRSPINHKTIKLWMITTHLFLPIPGYIIGYYFAYYFYQLLHIIHFGQLTLIVFSGMIWCWTLITCNSIYYSHSYTRKNDICEIKHNYLSIHLYILIIPMIQVMLLGIIRALFQSIDLYVYSFLSFFISLFPSIYISWKKPYNHDSMNNYATYLFVIRIPLSFTWLIKELFPDQFNNYLIFLIAFLFVSFLFLTQPFTSSQPLSTNSPDHVASPVHFSDPFQNWPFPFNFISATKQDVFLLFFSILSLFFISLIKAIVSQRVPLSSPLPDFIHERFNSTIYSHSKLNGKLIEETDDFQFIQASLFLLIFITTHRCMNLRRFFFLFGFLCILRAVPIMLTSLPLPYTAEPSCSCSRAACASLFAKTLVFVKNPKCGDLLISGQMMRIWLVTLTFCSALNDTFQRPFNWILVGLTGTFSFSRVMFILLSRDHYSIDIWFGFVFTQLGWMVYNLLRKLALMMPKMTMNSYCLRFIKWLETRPPGRVLPRDELIVEKKKIV